jgi:hypothetical protein
VKTNSSQRGLRWDRVQIKQYYCNTGASTLLHRMVSHLVRSPSGALIWRPCEPSSGTGLHALSPNTHQIGKRPRTFGNACFRHRMQVENDRAIAGFAMQASSASAASAACRKRPGSGGQQVAAHLVLNARPLAGVASNAFAVPVRHALGSSSLLHVHVERIRFGALVGDHDV